VTIERWLVWGFAATVLLTTVLAGMQGFGFTRMNLPFLLGTMVTPDRDRAKAIGIAIHAVNGWIFALLYFAIFHATGHASAAFGAAVGVVHGAFVMAVALPALPGFHPRMARPGAGPTGVRRLEPPGFLGLHYGFQTPLSVLLAHAVFGAVLGVVASWH
jgi:hypothetical protein